MKSILIAGSFAPSLINFRGPLIEALVQAGWRVVTTAPAVDPEVAGKIESIGATVVPVEMARTGLNPRADMAYGQRLATLIRNEGVNAVLTYTIKPNIWGAFAAAREGVPSVSMVTGLGYAFTESGESRAGLKRNIVGWMARQLYRRSTRLNHRVIFQNRDDIADFTAAGCLADKSKVRLVSGSGVDLAHYAPAPLPDEPRFLMIARLLRNKGVREYAEAAMRIMAEMPDVRFDLVGGMDMGADGISREELDRWLRAGLTYHGSQPDVRPFIAASSVYVLPSYREGTPRSSLEAMAMGRPVITTDAPGCRETVRSGDNGILVPVRDVDALAAAMRGLAVDGRLRAAMGAASVEFARERFDVHKVNQQVIAILEEVIEARI